MAVQHTEDRSGLRIAIRGTVQGVGFRPYVFHLAQSQRLTGRVRNDASGVTIEAFGSPADLERFVVRLPREAPAAANIVDLSCQSISAERLTAFSIAVSSTRPERSISIPPDLATCSQCLAEMRDPKDRRFGYAFINCTECGPRYSIATDVPYDRLATTMARFPLCRDCRLEYEDPANRRFHAEPVACPVCGPRLQLRDPLGHPLLAEEPVKAAAKALLEGRIVAVKGLGGYHLACDATSPVAVSRLRERKQRDQKPFAVMVGQLEQAESAAFLSDAERDLLRSTERPIVLTWRRPDSAIADQVAPRNPLLGLLLPYTPLHHLLLEAVGRPLVMTSGNRSDEPLAHRDEDALIRLGGLCDLFLTHDREIEAPCDDSVARVIAGSPTVLRRARGQVPRAIRLRRPVARPVLACGAQLKNAYCIASGPEARFGPHVGDLDNVAAATAFEAAIQRSLRFQRVVPEVVAHDLHPEYVSTAYARERPETLKVGVQHHHAHVVSALAQHGLAGPVLGLAWDGTGFGTDGTSWGSELLFADEAGFERLAHFRPLALPGGDQAVREVWRQALALLLDAGLGDDEKELFDWPLFGSVKPGDRQVVSRMARTGFNSPRACGMGRYFDAVGALALGRPRADYEGQIALEWNLAADPEKARPYPFELDLSARPWQVDLRPLVHELVRDLRDGRPRSRISARFHETVIAAGCELLRLAIEEKGVVPLVLTGGCFANARLVEGFVDRLGAGFDLRRHLDVPPGDGGLALGQAVIADARTRDVGWD